MDGAVSIGRNMDGIPMADELWKMFVRGVEKAVEDASGSIHATTYSRNGRWNGENEENAVITFEGLLKTAQLKSDLSWLARIYWQDKIALLLGQSELIGA